MTEAALTLAGRPSSLRIGILTGGGDAPGLNGVIAAASQTLLSRGHAVFGILDGFEGVFGGRMRQLHSEDLAGIHATAGTILGTSNRSGTTGHEERFLAQYRALNLDGLIVAGGDGTFAALAPFASLIPIVGLPKTIDNDLPGTELTFGFDTACSVVAEAVDALRSTANAHRRILVVETMGRSAGWIALGGGLASQADAILVPERPFSRSALLKFVAARRETGQRGFIAVVAEGAAAEGEAVAVARVVPGSPEPVRLGGIAAQLAQWLEHETGWEARHVVLGHLQRARAPTTSDRLLCAAMGVEAAHMAMTGAFGQAVVSRRGRIERAPLSELLGGTRRIAEGHPWVSLADALGIFV